MHHNYLLNLLNLLAPSPCLSLCSTRLLQPSLSGDAKISVICTINPSYSAVAESQSTLAFAAGIKRVVLSAKQTEVVDPAALIQQYQNEIAELKSKLAAKDAQGIKEPTGNRRMTTAEKEDHNKTTQRLALLRRLILTSTSVEEEEQREQEEVSWNNLGSMSLEMPQADNSFFLRLSKLIRRTRRLIPPDLRSL